MNVALIVERIETWRGGAETSTMQFANHLANLGCTVTAITASNSPSTPSVRVVPVRAGAGLRFNRTRLFARRAADYVRTHPFDIVHSITPCPAADVYQPRGGMLLEVLARNRAIQSRPIHRGLKRLGQGINLKYRVLANLERQLLKRQPPPWVIAISEYVADQIGRHYQFDGSRIRLIFNGVEPDETEPSERRADRRDIRRQFDLADDDLVVLLVAHNFKLKGVAALIQALALNRKQGLDQAYAIIVGRGNPAPFAREARQLGVADRIRFAGPTQRVQAFFHAADLLAHPTYYDPCSRVVLEAMASGLPVITTRFNGAAERIVDGQQGYVVDSPENISELADRIQRLANDAHRRDCAARAPREFDSFSMARHARNVLSLYQEILNKPATERRLYR